MKQYKTYKESETRVVAKKFAESLATRKLAKKALIIGFTGELGAGKTTFIKSFTRSMGVRKKITSPTFVILRRFKINSKPFKNIFHIDAYRISEKSELSAVGIDKILESPSNIVLVEWADRIKNVLPKDTIWVKFKYGKERDERTITID